MRRHNLTPGRLTQGSGPDGLFYRAEQLARPETAIFTRSGRDAVMVDAIRRPGAKCGMFPVKHRRPGGSDTAPGAAGEANSGESARVPGMAGLIRPHVSGFPELATSRRQQAAERPGTAVRAP